MFARRERIGAGARFVAGFSSFVRAKRSILYVARRLARLHGTPHAIGLGTAIGVFVSFTPILGVRMLVSIAMASLVGGNVPAAMVGAHFGNPLVYPFVAWACYAVGASLLGDEMSAAASLLAAPDMAAAVAAAGAVALELGLGIVVLGGATSALFYLGVRKAVERRRASRRRDT